MSFTFAIGCRLRDHGSTKTLGGMPWLFRTLIVTRLEYPRDIVSLAECGSVQLSSEDFPTARFTLLAAPTVRGVAGTRFSFLAEAPSDARISTGFLPASGDLWIRWKGRRPRVSARFGAPLADGFLPGARPALWTLVGEYVAWKGELLAGAELP